MNSFKDINYKNLHHAYLFLGDTENSRKSVLDFLIYSGVKVSGNPDVQCIKYDTLTKELVGGLVTSVAQKDFGSKNKIFVIETNIITVEAQNALLKVFEEPTVGTHFFILMPQERLLPTLRSRMQIIYSKNIQTKRLESILEKSIEERLVIIKKITDGITDEEKTKQDAIVLLNQIENELYEKGVKKEFNNLKLCQLTRSSLYDRGAPIKMILEQLLVCL